MAESISFNLGLSMRTDLMADIHADWLRQWLSGVSMRLYADLSQDATSMTVNTASWVTATGWNPSVTLQTNMVSTYLQQNQVQIVYPMSLSVGDAVLIGQSEPVTITSIGTPGNDGCVEIGISRGTTQTTPSGPTDLPLAIKSSFPAGTTISLLRYRTPWEYMATYLKLWAQGIHAAFGINSSLFSSSVSGRVSG